MSTRMLIASMVAGLALAPMAAVAADSSGDTNASTQMKGPPNANGATGNTNVETNANAGSNASSGSDGAASAKATGESGDASK